MSKNDYSAGAVKFSFWFPEFKKIILLLNEGSSLNDIKGMVENQNILSASTPARSKQVFTTVSKWIAALPEQFCELFARNDINTQKLIVIVAIMKTDLLFYEFMSEVYKEKLIVNDLVLTESDIRVFFTNKQRENDKIAKWTDETLSRLPRTYKSYLTEAGLIEKSVGNRKILRPILDDSLKRALSEHNLTAIYNILLGTR